MPAAAGMGAAQGGVLHVMDLGHDLLLLILEHLAPPDVCRLGLTCKAARARGEHAGRHACRAAAPPPQEARRGRREALESVQPRTTGTSHVVTSGTVAVASKSTKRSLYMQPCTTTKHEPSSTVAAGR